MQHVSRRYFGALVGGALVMPGVVTAKTTARRVSTDAAGTAIQGYDTRAYWALSVARVGDAAHVVVHAGAPWRFGSAAEADAFAATPERFAPKFGGFCTRAMSFGKTVHGDPEIWRIYNDALYLFAKPVGGRKFDEGQEAMITKAEAAWKLV